MAKNFPYFKFIATEWLTGDIVYEDLEIQGLYINICALYWQRDGAVTVSDLQKRYKRPDLITKLSENFFSVNGDDISIKFLDEQLDYAKHISHTNSKNGSKGGRSKALKTEDKKPTALSSESEIKANLSKEDIKENKNISKNINKDIKLRKINFSDTLKPYLATYGKDLLNDFFKYWTEENKSGTKFKQELERTWSLDRRLETWARNDKSFAKKDGSQKSKTETLIDVSANVKNLFKNE